MEDTATWEVAFLSGNPDLPVELPPGWPHIIDWDTVRTSFEDAELSEDGFHIANGIATVLHRYDPALLKNFLDFDIHKVTYNKKDKSENVADLVIERDKNHVMCGYYSDIVFNGDRCKEWDIRVKYSISCAGRWVPLEYATGLNARDTSRNAQSIAENGAMLTQAMLVNEGWEESDRAKIKTTCSKKLQ
ncbi:hypothetical protein MMC18_003722 [Xylographa bjoerkii]|nr:hypothetical protein [Xylographa bjoerkii]